MRVCLVAAVARGGVIGRDDGIPWRLPEDVARFKSMTTGNAVVMGRKTWDTLPARFRPLPDRRNVVVTRNAEWSAAGAERASSLEEALELLAGAGRIFVIGGAEIYRAALPHADGLLLTEIDLDVDGDTLFPEWDRDAFVEVAREEHVADDGTRFAFVSYQAREPSDLVAARQLSALSSVDALLAQAKIAYWLFGGWAVDFHAGRITRPHDDVDIAVWHEDVPRISTLLADDGWAHAPDPDEDGGTGYERDGVRLELTYLVRASDGRIVTPLRGFEAAWPKRAFEADVRELDGVRARVVALAALKSGKSSARDDDEEAAKDKADSVVLSEL